MVEMHSLPLFNQKTNLADSLLTLERTQFQGKLWEKASIYLSKLINSVEQKCLKDRLPQNQAAQLSKLFFQMETFRTAIFNESTHFTLCGTLNQRRGSCLGIATVFTVISDALGLNFRPLLKEGHIALVHPISNPPLIFETVQNSYTQQPILEFRSLKKREIMLTFEEFFAVHLSNQATFVYARAGLMDDAIFLIDSALEIFPDYTAGWINRAVIMKKIDNVKEMQRSLDIAKSLKPGLRYTKAIERIENNEL